MTAQERLNLKTKIFKGTLANMIYFTLPIPEILWEHISPIQEISLFTVYRYDDQKGVIFRIPNDLKTGTICHFFVEHEINLSNTLKSGNISPKIQITLVPIEYGEFQGFAELDGEYIEDEEDWSSYFKPDYQSENNVVKIKPLPPIHVERVFDNLKELFFNYGQDIVESTKVYINCHAPKLRKTVFVFDEENECINPQK